MFGRRISAERTWLFVGAVGVAYGAVSFTSLYFTRFGAEVEALWVSNALLAAALVASASRHWPWLVIAAACGHFSAHRIAGDPLGLSLTFLLSDMGESVLCALLLRARPNALALQNFAGVAQFLAICVLSATASCAATTFGNWALGAPLSGGDVLIWLLADALGLFIFLPLFFGLDEAQWRQARARPAQLLLALALTVALAMIGAYTQSPIPRLLALPLSVVIAFRFGVAGVELALSAILVTWVVLTYLGRPPGAWPDLDMRGYLLLAQAFVAALAMTVVPLAVILEDRERLSVRLAEAAKADAIKREAEKANAFKSRLIAMASHDLRQPVMAAQSYLDAIEARLSDPETQGICAKATQALDSMTSILEALLDVSRLDAGIIAPKPRDFPIGDLFERVAAVNRPRADAKGLGFVVQVSPHVVHSDPSLVERIVDNFVSNAIRYTDRGEVRLWTEMRGDTLAVNVTDTGIGIAPEALPSIFDDYVQLNNPERDRSKGLGLGLTIARRMASLLDLRIEVRTAGGEGSTFTIELPRASTPAP